MEKVLVTGGCGFIGSHIVDKLIDQGYPVVVVDNLSSGNINNIDQNDVDFYCVDITTPEFEEVIKSTKPKYIIHQAAQVSVSNSLSDIFLDANINILGSVNVINLAEKYKIDKIVFASTAAVYGNPTYLPVDNVHPLHPLSPYGLSKNTVEQYLSLSKKLFDINYTILRYSNVYGPRQDAKGEGGVVAVFSERLAWDKEVVIHGDGKQTRDFIYVEDVATANVQALKNANNQILNVSSNTRISINELFYILNKISGSSRIPSYVEKRAADIEHSQLCNLSTIKELDWLPKYSLVEGIELTIRHYNNQRVLS